MAQPGLAQIVLRASPLMLPQLILTGSLRSTYAAKLLAVRPSNLVAYWPLWEASGAVATDYSGHGYNGAYSGVDLGQEGIGDGRTAPYFDGANDRVNVFSAALAAAINCDEGTAMCWVKVSPVGIWTDGAIHRAFYVYTDVNNRLGLGKSGTNNCFANIRTGNAGLATTTHLFGPSLGWAHLAMTWSVAASRVYSFLNGVRTTLTTCNAWVGAVTIAVIGASDLVPTNPWSGWLAHCALWNTPLSQEEIVKLAQVR